MVLIGGYIFQMINYFGWLVIFVINHIYSACKSNYKDEFDYSKGLGLFIKGPRWSLIWVLLTNDYSYLIKLN